MYKLEFELPGLPPTTNGSHGKWQYAYAKRKKWRKLSCEMAEKLRPKAPLKSVKITLTRFSSSQPDFDNLVISFKSVVDGLKDSGVILDDKDSVVIERKYLWEKTTPKLGKIKVEVEEL